MGENVDETAEASCELSWSESAARERPHAAAAGIVLAAGASVYVYYSFESILYAAICVFVLLASLLVLFLPATYTIDGEGIHKRGFLSSKSKSWSDLACFIRRGGIVGVSTEMEPSYRSLSEGFLIRSPQGAEEIAQCLSRYLPECVVEEQPDAGEGEGESV